MQKEDPVRYHEAWQQLCSSQGVLIPGGFGVRGMQGKVLAVEWARKTKKPFLGEKELGSLGEDLARVDEFGQPNTKP